MLGIELIRRLFAQLQEFYRRYRSRQQLLSLDDHILNDIGITYDQARTEAAKPFWRR